MKHFTYLLALFLIVLPAAAQAEDICNGAERSPDGKIAVQEATKGKVKGVIACAFIDAPADQVYNLLIDYESFPKWMDKVEGIRAEWPSSVTANVDYEIGTIVGTYKYRLERVHEKPVAVRWNRVSGDLKHVSGRYAFLPVDGKQATLLVIETYVDPGKPLPGFIESYFTQKGSRQIMKDVRAEIARRSKR